MTGYVHSAYTCMMKEVAVQIRIPLPVANRLRAVAAQEGLTLTAWTTRIVMKQLVGMKIEAWPKPRGETVRVEPQAAFLIEVVREGGAGGDYFALLWGPGNGRGAVVGAPVSKSGATDIPFVANPEGYVLWLGNSPQPRIIVTTFFDETSHRQIVVLRLPNSGEVAVVG